MNMRPLIVGSMIVSALYISYSLLKPQVKLKTQSHINSPSPSLMNPSSNSIKSNNTITRQNSVKHAATEPSKATISSDNIFTEQEKTIFTNNNNDFNFSDPDQARAVFISAQKLSDKLIDCLKQNSCNQQSTYRDGVEYFDPENTLYHSYLGLAIKYINKSLIRYPQLADELNTSVLYQSLSVQHSSIPLESLNVLIHQLPDQIDAGKALKGVKQLNGPIRAKALALLSHPAKNQDKQLVYNEIFNTISQANNRNTAWTMLKELHSSNISNDQFIQATQSSCHLLKVDFDVNTESRRFYRTLQKQLNHRAIDLSPKQICG